MWLFVILACGFINCNEILSPWQDGDDESERAATSESDGKCGGREAERTRSLPPAAFERAPSIYNNITGLRWLRKFFKVRERRVYLGLESWAGIDRSN